LLADFVDNDVRTIERDGEKRELEVSKVFSTSHFGFRRITVERPLRLDFQATPERIDRLQEESAFRSLAVSRKKGAAKGKEEAAGREKQSAILEFVRTLPATRHDDRAEFEAVLTAAADKAGLKLAAPIKKAILSALSERNPAAAVCRDASGHPEADLELRDTENVPLSESVEAFFEREVLPHVPDAWIDTSKRDPRDGEVGSVGYEINFNRYFYRYDAPRALEAIEADIQAIEKDILGLLRAVAGGAAA
ncbi:MAG: SAM-dependent DNA methyltransferase, partial [Gemmatimonadota bacterium]|nr:SAM-dependent DNA methyltransferase [Gemmatimonadota bacterium]